MKKYLKKIRSFIDYVLYYNKYLKITKSKQYNIYSFDETIDKIVLEGKSISRFGDGEFKWILDIPQKSFQDSNSKMKERLKEVLTTRNDKLIIGITDTVNSLKDRTIEAKSYWAKFYVKNMEKLCEYMDCNKMYGDANITRVYMDYKNKNYNVVAKRFDKIKSMWEQKHILLVEGRMSKLGADNDLFDNALSVQRIICPSENAFEKYEEIIEKTKKNGKDKLILFSLGPTATILSYDLAKEGYHAIDIGHIDVEYSWFLMGANHKVPINGKYVNEAKNKNKNKNEVKINEDYTNQIIDEIK